MIQGLETMILMLLVKGTTCLLTKARPVTKTYNSPLLNHYEAHFFLTAIVIL